MATTAKGHQLMQ